MRGGFGSPSMLSQTLKHARRVIVAVVGFTVVTLGIVMLVTPGPGWAVIFLGLSILAVEFVWARRLLKRLKKAGSDVAGSIFGWRKKAQAPDKEQTPESDTTHSADAGDDHNKQAGTLGGGNR